MGNERNRSIRPFLQILGEADAGGQRAEHDRLHEHAGHEEVDVGTVADRVVRIAPPNTYRNISTKMIGWIVANMSSSGLR